MGAFSGAFCGTAALVRVNSIEGGFDAKNVFGGSRRPDRRVGFDDCGIVTRECWLLRDIA
jgi:hypothetical protein